MTRQIVVLGGGMVGASTALALQARNYDVLLLDRSPPGSETSFGNAGFIQGEASEPYALPRDLASLCRIALKRDNGVDWDWTGLCRNAPSLFSYWRNSAPARHRSISLDYSALVRRALDDHAKWIAVSGADALMNREGYRLIFRNDAAFEKQTRKAERWRALYGSRFDVEDAATLASAEPALRQTLAGAIHWHDSWTCSDPSALVKAYVDLFSLQGGTWRRAELFGLKPSRGAWRVVTSEGPIEAAHVVVALGPWSPQLLAPLGYRINMVRKRGYHMHVGERKADGARRRPGLTTPIIDADFGAVYSPMRVGLRICTGADLSAAPVKDMPRQLKRAHSAASALLDLGAPLEQPVWAGVRPCMPDMLPLVGAAPRHSGLWFNFGHGHQGFTLGPTTGHLLAGLIDGDPDAIARPLAPSRLAQV